jgi:hypothetical protein
LTIEEKTTVETDAQNDGAERNLLREVVENLLTEIRSGAGDRDKRRHVEEWMKSLGEKYPDFGVEQGLRDYYLAEAKRLRGEFDNAKDLTEKLNLGRSVETFLDKAADYERRVRDRAKAQQAG